MTIERRAGLLDSIKGSLLTRLWAVFVRRQIRALSRRGGGDVLSKGQRLITFQLIIDNDLFFEKRYQPNDKNIFSDVGLSRAFVRYLDNEQLGKALKRRPRRATRQAWRILILVAAKAWLSNKNNQNMPS